MNNLELGQNPEERKRHEDLVKAFQELGFTVTMGFGRDSYFVAISEDQASRIVKQLKAMNSVAGKL
jgi:hypothetical protein